MDIRERVAVYVTRSSAGGLALLVFDHRNHPEAGTQVPAGGLEPGETLDDAARREVREETGITDVIVDRQLGVQRRPHPETGQPRVTTFVHAMTRTDARRWTHRVDGTDGDSGIVFDCYFMPLTAAIRLLPAGQDEFLRSIQ